MRTALLQNLFIYAYTRINFAGLGKRFRSRPELERFLLLKQIQDIKAQVRSLPLSISWIKN